MNTRATQCCSVDREAHHRLCAARGSSWQGARSVHAMVRRKHRAVAHRDRRARRADLSSEPAVGHRRDHRRSGGRRRADGAAFGAGPADGHPADDPEPRAVRLVGRAARDRDRGRDVRGLLRVEYRARGKIAAWHRVIGVGACRHRDRRGGIGPDRHHRIPVHSYPEPHRDMGARHRYLRRLRLHPHAYRDGRLPHARRLQLRRLARDRFALGALADRVRALRVRLFALPAGERARRIDVLGDLSRLHDRLDARVRLRRGRGAGGAARRRCDGRREARHRTARPADARAVPAERDQPQRA